MIKLLLKRKRDSASISITVGILGITFKENVSDIRNTRVAEIVSELEDYGVRVLVNDPYAKPDEVLAHYNIPLCGLEAFSDLDGLTYAVQHEYYKELIIETIVNSVVSGGVIIDVKSVLSKHRT